MNSVQVHQPPRPSGDDQCTATSRQTGERCKAWAVKGTTICRHHGGSAPQVRAKAAERERVRRIEEHAAKVLAYEGVTAVEDPLDELGKLANSAMALQDALGARVNAMSKLEHFSTEGVATMKAEVAMYERAMDRTHRLLDSLVKHGYTERQIRIKETEAVLIAGVIRRVLQAIGLTPEQVLEANRLMAEEFRKLEEAEHLI